MAQQDIIREFLVSLGFKVDQKGLKSFTDTIEGSTKAVAGLIAGIEAAALTIGGLVQSFANKTEQLYFAAQRVGDSSADLKAFGNAARNMGVDAGEALGNVESLAAALRNNPGNEGLMNALGVKTRSANGQLRDSVDMLVDLGKQLQGYDTAVRRQYANQFGMSEKMLLALSDPRFASELEKQRDLLKGSGFDKAAQDAHKFEVALRNLQTRVDAVGVVIANSLMDALGPQMDKATVWFEKNADKISKAISFVAVSIVNLGAIVLPILDKIAEGWRLIFNLVKDTGIEINKLLPETWKNNIGKGTNWFFEKLGIADAVYDMAGGPGKGGSVTPRKFEKQSADSIVKKLMDWGWTREQAIGITANLVHESDLNPGAVGDGGAAYGIAQWHPDRQAEFEKFSGHSIKQSTLDEQIAFLNYELTQGNERMAGAMLKAATNAQQSSAIVTQYYERPKDTYGETLKRGETAVQMSQTTTINVNGSADPHQTAQDVLSGQRSVNADMTRNLENRAR